MRTKPLKWVVALDGGTTNTRARLLLDGRVVATARRHVGVRDAVLSGRDRPIESAAREAILEVLGAGGVDRPDAVVASGMLSSEVGLAAVPHVPAPAGLTELAAAALEIHLPSVCEWPVLFVPGVRTPPSTTEDGWAVADLMRGEECEALGALSRLGETRPVALLFPGSHAKLMEVDACGRIARSTTSLAGEIADALANHTLIAASLPDALPDSPDKVAAATGLRLGASEGLGRCAFLVRVAAVTGALSEAERASFWVGAVVGDDAAHLARSPILAGGLPLKVGGREPLRGLYVNALRGLMAAEVAPLDDETAEWASAEGALAVVRRRADSAGGPK